MRAAALGDSTISWNSKVSFTKCPIRRLLNAVVITGCYLQEGHEGDAIPFLDPQPLLGDFDDYDDSFDHSTTPDFLPHFPDVTRRACEVYHQSQREARKATLTHSTPHKLQHRFRLRDAGQLLKESILASTPELHLSSCPPASAISKKHPPHLPIPQTAQALQTYHHTVTLFVPSQPTKPLKAQNTPYANIALCPPRAEVIGPSYPVSQSTLDDTRAGKGEKEFNNKPIFPSAPPCPPSSRLPDLARQILLPSALARTARLAHPPALRRGNQKPYHDAGIRNSSGSGAPTGRKGKTEGTANGRSNEPPTFVLPDSDA
ncbi:hypothetical protein DFJ58DRAFT_864984 [Suillus subalutaceus]|uniref:uncharacterized protein n=1 Tax=Suillus subalutaceus TaxID=48586 RepID=UPI001B86A5EF|nr:uncharacterized protein DFJ58DRAFT_864984 [Suillus subalutaceus]KAG1836502.1 hypothetical protein DFJ58DRAFT_864984 [Suillus subalutaceus]